MYICKPANLGVAVELFNPPYDGSVKEPDLCWQMFGEDSPLLVVEVGCPRTYPDRLRGMNVWMGAVTPPSAAILIILERGSGGMGSFVEVFRPARVNGFAENSRMVRFPWL